MPGRLVAPLAAVRVAHAAALRAVAGTAVGAPTVPAPAPRPGDRAVREAPAAHEARDVRTAVAAPVRVTAVELATRGRGALDPAGMRGEPVVRSAAAVARVASVRAMPAR